MGIMIVNADDFGLSRAVNLGIVEGHQLGIVTSTTLMANMPGFDHAVELAKENPNLGIGVHLTLTAGYPLLQTHKTIITDEGKLRPLSVYERKSFDVDQQEVFDEWDAQIQKVIDAGIIPTHLDSHHHTHTFGENREVIIKLAQKYKLPVRGNIPLPEDIPHTARMDMNFDMIADVSELTLRPYLENIIADCLHYGTIELICHPAYLDRFVLENSGLNTQRTRTLDFLIHSEFSQFVKENKDIRLENFSVIK